MSDHDTTIPHEADDEIRARMRAFAVEVKERVDTETALHRMPRRSRPPTIGLLAIAACTLAVVALAAAVAADRQSVDTTDPSVVPTQTTDCSSTTQPRAITQGAQMKNKLVAPIAAAVVLLAACSDDGPTTLAEGEDVNFVGGAPGLSDQTLDITAEEDGGKVTGEARFSPAGLILDLQCADTGTDGLVVIGGQATADAADGSAKGDRVAVVIWDGDPDQALIWFEQPLPDGAAAAGSCQEFLDAIPDDELDEDAPGVADVADGDDIETG